MKEKEAKCQVSKEKEMTKPPYKPVDSNPENTNPASGPGAPAAAMTFVADCSCPSGVVIPTPNRPVDVKICIEYGWMSMKEDVEGERQ